MTLYSWGQLICGIFAADLAIAGVLLLIVVMIERRKL